jgi:hypothetical protein
MATSKHLGIRDAVAALYAAATALAGGRISENRDVPLPDGIASQINVYRIQSQPERELVGATAPIDWTTVVRTVIKARKSGGSSAEAVADDIACSCYARLMADQALGGLVQDMRPGPFVWDQDEAESNVVQVVFDIEVVHRTEFNAIT